MPEADAWYRYAIDRGYVGAMFNLGYLLGLVHRDDEGEYWYRRAAEAQD